MLLFTVLNAVIILSISNAEPEEQTIAVCRTITGQAEGRPCHFPFQYNGAIIATCIKRYSTYYWCATEPKYHTNNYGQCSSNCPLENVTATDEDPSYSSPSDTAGSCNDEWRKCNSVSIPEFGCDDPDVREGCKKSCNACEEGTTSDPNPTQCKTISGSGSRENTPCLFPFTFEEKIYHECTKKRDSQYWCATATPFSWYDFGYCNEYCPIEPEEKDLVAGYKKVFDQTNRTCGGYIDHIISTQQITTSELCADLCNTDAKCWYFFYGNVGDCILYQSCLRGGYTSLFGSTYLKEGCKTVSGKDPNVPCVFPFEAYGELHYSCTIKGDNYANEYWCATNEEWMSKNNYGTCDPSCPNEMNMECKVKEASSGVYRPCVFPFTYLGALHYGCIKQGLSKAWCPTQLLDHTYQRNKLYAEDFIDIGTYGYCNSECPTEKFDDYSIHNSTDCSCSDFIDPLGEGKCQASCTRTKDQLCCYVNQPTGCDDARPSPVHFGEVSEQACKKVNDEWNKYIYLGAGYCYPTMSEHPNLLEAIETCEKDTTCNMLFVQWRSWYDEQNGTLGKPKVGYLGSTRSFFICPDWAYVNSDATYHTQMYVLEEDASEVKAFVPEIALKFHASHKRKTEMMGPYVSFFTFVVLVCILVLRAVIRAIRKISTYIKSFQDIFGLICIYLAGYMTLIESLRYVENKDASSFGYKKFGESPRDRYPTFSICLHSVQNNFFLYFDSTLKNITGRNKNTFTEYESILSGLIFYQNGVLKALQEISFKQVSESELHKVSYQLKDFVHRLEFEDRNSRKTEKYDEDDSTLYPNGTLPLHISYKDSRTICFTRNSDSNTTFERRSDMISFPIQTLIDTELYIQIYIHHPGQLTRSLDKPVLKSKAIDLEENSNVIFNINDVSVLRRRPDAIQKCDEKLHDDDQKFRDEVTQVVGCVPSYWMSLMTNKTILRECKSAPEMSQIYSILKTYKRAIFDSYKQPCDYMKVTTGVLQKKLQWGIYLVFEFVYMDDLYQEIVNVRDFGFESFWSGVGGFVGIFLGYSLLQMPDLLKTLWDSTANKRLKLKEAFKTNGN